MIELAEPMLSERLCLTIKQFWRLRGHKVEAWVEQEMYKPYVHQKSKPIFAIKSVGIPVRLP